MTDFREIYNSKLTSAAQAAKRVQCGWTIFMDAGCAQAPALVKAVEDRAYAGELENVTIHNMLDVYPFGFHSDSALDGKVNGVSWFASGYSRKAIAEARCGYVPAYYRDMPSHMSKFRYDAVFVEVSPMDKHGYFSLGTVASNSEGRLRQAEHIFVVVNDRQPRAVCGLQVHVCQVTAIVEDSHELPVLPETKLDDISVTIGNYIAEQIPDGACIQLGIGAIPDATGMALKTKHDLGIHTEMFTDSMVELLECGAANNSKKQIHTGKSVTTFAYGSKRIYDYIDDNPSFVLLPVSYVNDPYVIAQNDNMISVNAAVEVDLWGQVCAESIGTRLISGTGGQVDYVRGACQSRGGKSFIAFSSTVNVKGKISSKIQPILTPGAICTTGKNDVDCIVTEYGIAKLRGRPLSERVKALISIAHPDFRDELTFEAKKRGMI
ncbi:MAG: acetyl-CoA hydrolase/transferase C-terminal domain-containing protein [Eubacteriales bacterium]|nr:acetyl-CoA hydrolase/transferase C-terminal domain-containing protein [Eubacteriales bacterium]